VVPTQNQGVGNSMKSKIEDTEFDKIIDARIELLKKLQNQWLNSIDKIENQSEEVDTIQELESDDIDDSGFFLEDKFNFHLGSMNHNDI
jgi:hypothetical protein